MAKETFQVTLTDEQLQAAKAAAARRGVNLGPTGSLSRDSVTVNYSIEAADGSNAVSVDVLYRPFYVDAATVQSLITEFLTNPPAPDMPPIEPPAEPPAEAPPTTEAASVESEQHSRRSSRR